MSGDSTPKHPTAGDVCLGCVHRPDPNRCRYFYLTKPLPFKRQDGSRGNARWILVCKRCSRLEGGDTSSAIKKGLVPIGCDMPWPDDLHVDIDPPVVH